MNDTLNSNLYVMQGIPSLGVRVTILVCIFFVLAITIVLVYFKMKQSDERNKEMNDAQRNEKDN